jgi:hypothetical protein
MLTNDQYAAYRAINTVRCPRCSSSNIAYHYPDGYPDTEGEGWHCLECELAWADVAQVTGYEVLSN